MNISIPNLSLVVLIGPSGSGKTTFACKHFRPTEVLSSDGCRGMVSDDENNQEFPVAVVLNLPERLCQDRNRSRDERNFGPHVVRQQHSQLRRSIRGLEGRAGHGRLPTP